MLEDQRMWEAIDRAEWQDRFLEVVEDLNYLFEGGVFYENNVNAWDGVLSWIPWDGVPGWRGFLRHRH